MTESGHCFDGLMIIIMVTFTGVVINYKLVKKNGLMCQFAIVSRKEEGAAESEWGGGEKTFLG